MNKTTNVIGLFIMYLRERGYIKRNSTTLIHPKSGDVVTIEYVRGVSALYYSKDSGHTHVIRYEDCPLPSKTLEWWHKTHKPKAQQRPRRRRAARVVRATTMAQAFKEAKQ